MKNLKTVRGEPYAAGAEGRILGPTNMPVDMGEGRQGIARALNEAYELGATIARQESRHSVARFANSLATAER